MIILVLSTCGKHYKTVIKTKIPSEYWLESESTLKVQGFEVLKFLVEIENFSPGPLLLLDNNTAVISNTTNSEVFFCNLTDNEVKKIIQFGDGPEELIEISAVFRTVDGFGIHGNSSKKICYFNNSGEFISSEILIGYYSDVDELDGNIVLLLANKGCNPILKDSDDCLFVFSERNDSSNIILSKLDRYNQMVKIPKEQGYIGALGKIVIWNNSIYLTNMMQNYVYMTNIDGSNERYIYMEEDFFNRHELAFKNGELARGIGVNTDIDLNENGLIFLGKHVWNKENQIFRIDVLNQSGEFLKTLQIDNLPMFISCFDSKILIADNYRQNNIMIYDIPKL